MLFIVAFRRTIHFKLCKFQKNKFQKMILKIKIIIFYHQFL